MTHMKRPLITILLALVFLTVSCTNDNSITGNSNQSLNKPTDITEIATGVEEVTPAEEYMRKLLAWIVLEYIDALAVRDGGIGCAYVLDGDDTEEHLSKPYDFRDNYLSKSEKGEVYTACYYLLSTYGIKNNLVNKYYKEHIELLKTSTAIAYNLQHGTNNDRILIENEFANNLREMLNIYKQHPNHRDIDPVLDYLEMDLKKYKNEPKYKIAVDFQER